MPLLLCKLERIVVALTKSRECTKTQACIQWPKLQKLEKVKLFNKADDFWGHREYSVKPEKPEAYYRIRVLFTRALQITGKFLPYLIGRHSLLSESVSNWIYMPMPLGFLNLQRSFYAVEKLKKMCIDKEIQKYFSAFAFGPEKFCLLCCDTWWNVLRMMRLIWRILRSKPYTEMWGGGSC